MRGARRHRRGGCQWTILRSRGWRRDVASRTSVAPFRPRVDVREVADTDVTCASLVVPYQTERTMSTLVDRIHAIYDRMTPCIHPFIGAAFRNPAAADLRVMGVGINAYSCGDDFGRQAPGLNAAWFEKQTYRFHRAVLRDLSAICLELTRPPFAFAGKTFRGIESIFLTNAVKVYVREAEGKRAAQLSPRHFEEHLAQWRDELDALAEADALPHVIAVIGDPFWKYACASFQEVETFRSIRVRSHRWAPGKCLHYVNRFTLEGPRGAHELLLVRLRHPASRRSAGAPRWLLGQAEFQRIAAAE